MIHGNKQDHTIDSVSEFAQKVIHTLKSGPDLYIATYVPDYVAEGVSKDAYFKGRIELEKTSVPNVFKVVRTQ